MLLKFFEICMRVLTSVLNVVWIEPINLIAGLKPLKQCSQIEDELLLVPAVEIVQRICNREITCYTLVSTYIRRITEVNPLLNAMVENRFTHALYDAQQLDLLIAHAYTQHSPIDKTAICRQLADRYPLLGVPVTVKESIAVNGMSNACGCKPTSMNEVRRADSDADVVARLRQRGAVIVCVTNTPQLCVNWETCNYVTGVTNNPYDVRRTSGGSSGGEAALLASAGSLVGIGSDLAGSLRLPCHFCGIYGHKPSPETVPPGGHHPDNSNNPRQYSLGPLSRYAMDLPMMLKALLPDKAVFQLKLDANVDLSSLKVFYINKAYSPITNSVSKPTADAIKTVALKLEKKLNISVKELSFPDFRSASLLSLFHLLLMPNVPTIRTLPPKLRNPYWELCLYFCGRSDCILFAILHPIIVQLMSAILSPSYKRWVHSAIDEFRDSLESVLGENGVLLAPVFTDQAHYHNQILGKVFDTSMMAVFNATGMPVTTCPVGLVKGLPIAIQIISKTNCDRNSLAISQEIERITGGWKPPSDKIV